MASLLKTFKGLFGSNSKLENQVGISELVLS